MTTEAEETTPAPDRRILRLVYAALFVLGILFVGLLVAMIWSDTAAFWLPDVLHGTILLWLLAVVLLGVILVAIVAKLTNKQWLLWSSVAAAITLTITICVILGIVWLFRNV